MNIIITTTGKRPQLLKQTLSSLRSNAADWSAHTLTVVLDGPETWDGTWRAELEPEGLTIIANIQRVGASRSRNIGASSIPKYRRQEHVLFLDDDVAMLRGWDDKLLQAAKYLRSTTLISPYGHPFNIEDEREDVPFAKFPLLISSVAAFMSWKSFDEIGYWLEPGGAAGSEDFEFCDRARKLGHDFAVLNPHVCIHTGLTSSNGKEIVGADLLKERNAELERLYKIEGTVIYG